MFSDFKNAGGWTGESSRHRQIGTVAVYEMTVGRANTIRVTPRFYLGSLRWAPPPDEPLLHPMHEHSMYDSDPHQKDVFIEAQCDNTHLSIRVDWRTLANIPLISSRDCDVVYIKKSNKTKWAFSSDHNYAAFLKGEDFIWPNFVCGSRVCPAYLRFSRDTNRVPLHHHSTATCEPEDV
jgi:hypothetical protein